MLRGSNPRYPPLKKINKERKKECENKCKMWSLVISKVFKFDSTNCNKKPQRKGHNINRRY